MTRIAVISDSHGAALRLKRMPMFCEAEKIDLVLHLGDMIEDARALERSLTIPVCAVRGNCDYYDQGERERRLTVEGKRILMTHGDMHGVKYGYDRLSYYAEENGMDVALFGHTHRAFMAVMGRVLMINPGALKNGSLCLLEVDEKDIVPHMMDLDIWYRDRSENV